jgi:RNA polymerase sigma-70 factor (ECF subfamily)
MQLTSDVLSLRPYLFRIAYNMLGTIEESEDLVQDVFEKWISVESAREPKAYLARMTVNHSIRRLEELKQGREAYTGYWLPEPYITLDPDPVPTIEYGMLRLIESLNPLERAVFILRESFSEDYTAIAEMTGLSPDNCRQLLHRAHEKIGRKKAPVVDPERQRALTEAFLVALHGQDRSALTELLRNDIALFNDGGGKRSAALKPLFGAEKALKFLFGVMQLPEARDNVYEYRPAYVNGLPAALIFCNGEIDGMQYCELDDNGIVRLLYVRNPDKLKIREIVKF